MSKHAEFRRKLSAILPENCRPFVCQGSPYDCKIFVVGLNPATLMEDVFWQYWSDSTGFDKDSWFEAYKNERKSRPLKPGKKSRRDVGNTRSNLNKLADLIRTDEILETNIYSKPTEHYTELRAEEKDTVVFQFLMTEIKPKLIITHGKDPARYFDRKVREFGDFEIETVIKKGNSYDIMSVPHLSIGWSTKKLAVLADIIYNNIRTAKGSVSGNSLVELNQESVGSNSGDVLNFSDCLKYVEENGHANSIAAIHRSKANLDPNISIEYWWGNAETPIERSRCIRGAFHRISKKSLKDGRCSSKFNSTYRVVSG